MIDAKATVKVGPFAHGGKSRVLTKAADHDFQPEATVTPVGIFLPKGTHPVVELVPTIFQTGVKLTKEAMDVVETRLQRLPLLNKWFEDFKYSPPDI